MISLLLALCGTAHGASLDLLDVAGPWGTPASEGPTGVWWNPAMIGFGGGTRFLVEGAPTLANIRFQRDDPYPSSCAEEEAAGEDCTYTNWGGEDRFRYFGVAPFLGVSSDFGVKGLGIGAAMVVPHARGAKSIVDDGPARFHLREANIQAIYAMLGASYTYKDMVSVGVSGAYVHSTYYADLDNEVMSAVADQMGDLLNRRPDEVGYNDDILEDPAYSTRTGFGPMQGNGFTFAAGVAVRPVSWLTISASYNHGVKISHEGGVSLDFGCPPDTDVIGRFAFESEGLCDAKMDSDGVVTYWYPSRVNAGVAVTPVDRLRLELMGGWVGWSKFTDYAIETSNVVSQNTEVSEDTAKLLEQHRSWARDNNDTFWLGLDGKVDVHDLVLVGARALFDHHAVPDSALSPNNYDADDLQTGVLVALRPIPELEIGLSYNHHFVFARTVHDSLFGVTLNPDERNEDRYFWPSETGTTTGSIDRFGLSVRGTFLDLGQKKKDKAKKPKK